MRVVWPHNEADTVKVKGKLIYHAEAVEKRLSRLSRNNEMTDEKVELAFKLSALALILAACAIGGIVLLCLQAGRG